MKIIKKSTKWAKRFFKTKQGRCQLGFFRKVIPHFCCPIGETSLLPTSKILSFRGAKMVGNVLLQGDLLDDEQSHDDQKSLVSNMINRKHDAQESWSSKVTTIKAFNDKKIMTIKTHDDQTLWKSKITMVKIMIMQNARESWWSGTIRVVYLGYTLMGFAKAAEILSDKAYSLVIGNSLLDNFRQEK